ncbi:hypothetical protein B4U79_06460 [Dinothrombium tinctorium]|uniref:Uncharacterized protein n=1 Tax=Dinothrombium tinctorium TaxID=1965070 RepID=A0A443RIZ5_9ACAR|nr:hypothetical protein B4U79_06460 [Dinothrombium tinctorium]
MIDKVCAGFDNRIRHIIASNGQHFENLIH